MCTFKKNKANFLLDYNLWIVMEFCSIGTVKDIINITKQNLNEIQIQIIIKECLNGLNYLHKNKIIHTNIKSSSVLIHSQQKYYIDRNLLITGYIRKQQNELNNSFLYIPPEFIKIFAMFYQDECNDSPCKLQDDAFINIIYDINYYPDDDIQSIFSPHWNAPEWILDNKLEGIGPK